MLKISNRIYLIIILLLSTQFIFGSTNDSIYVINVKIKNYKNADLYFGYHFGQKKVILDTIRANNKGVVKFTGKKLDGGIYIVAFPNKDFFEILIDEDQIFEIETDTTDFVNNMKISGSDENIIFNNYQRKMHQFQINNFILNKRLQQNETNNDSTKLISQKIEILQKNIRETWINEAKKYDGKLFGKLINAMIEPEFPQDSSKAFQYYKDHYWDNIDLNDERLLRSPILHSKLNRYLSNAIEQRPDSIVKTIEKLILRTSQNEKIYRNFLMQILSYYESSNAYAMDEVFIYLAEKYIINNAKFWNNEHFIEITNYKIKIKKGIVTGQIAPNVTLENTKNELISLLDVEAKLTVVYFWEPDCGYCQKTTPKINELFEKYKDNGLQIYAVNCETDKKDWVSYLDSNNFNKWINVYDPNRLSNFQESFDIIGTPVIYLLDENKRIVAKKINAETLERLLDYFYNIMKK